MRRFLTAVVLLFSLLLLIALIAGSSQKSKALPPGQWGKVVSCLEGHPLFAVYDAASSNAAAPSPSTTKLDVWQNIKGIDLADVTRFGTPAAAQAASRADAASETQVGDPSDNVGAIGPVEYLFVLGGDQNPPQPLADSLNQLDITDCIQEAYPGRSGLPGALSTSRPKTTTTPGNGSPNQALPTTIAAPPSVMSATCGTLTSAGGSVLVARTTGTPCATIRSLFTGLSEGRGSYHAGAAQGDSYTALDGWRCFALQGQTGCTQNGTAIASILASACPAQGPTANSGIVAYNACWIPCPSQSSQTTYWETTYAPIYCSEDFFSKLEGINWAVSPHVMLRAQAAGKTYTFGCSLANGRPGRPVVCTSPGQPMFMVDHEAGQP